jgi:hypothetical protein
MELRRSRGRRWGAEALRMEIPAVVVTCTRVADASKLARGNGCASVHVQRRAGSDRQQLGSRLDSVGIGSVDYFGCLGTRACNWRLIAQGLGM